MKGINISCLGARFVSSWSSYGLKQGIPWNCLFLFYIEADTTRICRKYRLIQQKNNEINNNMAYGGRYLWFWGLWFCGVCGGGVGVEAST